MAHPDLDELLNEAIDAATHFLENIGEFFPFVVTMSPDGKVSHAQEHLPGDAAPADETVDHLLAGLKKAAAKGQYRATAIVCDSRATPPGGAEQPAIRIVLEHRTESPVTCYLPYKQANGRFEFGDVFAKRAERQVFPLAAKT